MPEGDTIFRTAVTLEKAIGGQVVRSLRSPLPEIEARAPAVEGRPITRVEARGKYLLVHFEDGSALLTHMKMTGSWHIYRPGERWQKSPRAARVVIATDPFVAVCFAAPVVEMIPSGKVERHPALASLGPDLLRDDFDPIAARTRLRERSHLTIAEALLSQGALAGIGNVYKSEVLFLCRIDPFVPVSAIPDEALDAAIAKARELMAKNLDGGPRTTTGPRPFSPRGARPFVPRLAPRSFVYDRAGLPCLVCNTPVRVSRTLRRAPAEKPNAADLPASGGESARTTFYCERCQREGATGTLPEILREPP